MSERQALTDAEAAFVTAQRVGRLATVDATGRPAIIPVCYAYDGASFYTPLDAKPKRVADDALQRVRNIVARHEASLIVDQYDDDWSRLGYVFASGHAELLAPGAQAHATALTLLRARYAQYRAMDLETRTVIMLTPQRVASWGPALATAQEPVTWPEPGRSLDFLPLARGRQSVRAFAERPVPREALETLLDAARWAPSPHGRQPWRFVVLTNPAAKQRLADAMGEEWQRTLEMDQEPPTVVQKRLRASRDRIAQAPALALVCLYLADLDRYPDAERQRAEEVMAIQSLGAAVQNMLLAAYTLGLDTGWMCAPLFCPDAVRDALALDAAYIPHALIPIGYKAAEPRRRAHRPPEELAIWFE